MFHTHQLNLTKSWWHRVNITKKQNLHAVFVFLNFSDQYWAWMTNWICSWNEYKILFVNHTYVTDNGWLYLNDIYTTDIFNIVTYLHTNLAGVVWGTVSSSRPDPASTSPSVPYILTKYLAVRCIYQYNDVNISDAICIYMMLNTTITTAVNSSCVAYIPIHSSSADTQLTDDAMKIINSMHTQ